MKQRRFCGRFPAAEALFHLYGKEVGQMQKFEFYAPGTVEEALRVLSETPGVRTILAGGTDVIPQLHEGRRETDSVVAVNQLRALHGVELTEDTVKVGACSTFTELECIPYIRDNVRVLYDACAHVGSPQIRNLGTVGGNIVNASVAGDSITAFLALGASVVLRSVRGERVLRLQDFYPTMAGSCIQPDELLVCIRFPRPDERTATAFYKLGKRNALAIVEISGGVVLQWDETGCCTHAAVRGGALARFPLEFTRVQEYLLGKPITKEVLYGCMGLLSDAVYESIRHRPLEVGYKKDSVKGVFMTVFDDILEQYARLTQQDEGRKFA